MSDLTVVILTKDERLHIRRCLERLLPLEPSHILVIDCFSTDGTLEIVDCFSREKHIEIKVIGNEWPGSQAEQFNWTIDHCGIDTEWVLRIDADEYLTQEAIQEVKETLPSLPESVSALTFPLARTWMQKPVSHGVGTVILTRLFRRGKARYGVRLMDEHLEVDGEIHSLKHPLVDDNLNDLEWWTKKHLNYALREALDLLRMEYAPAAEEDARLNANASAKRMKKSKYARLPLFWRSFAYFLYRYVLKGGFLDGRAGFTWNFFQGWWYRAMVDARIVEIKRETGVDKDPAHAWEKIREYARRRGIKI